jgi:hypothetical protein
MPTVHVLHTHYSYHYFTLQEVNVNKSRIAYALFVSLVNANSSRTAYASYSYFTSQEGNTNSSCTAYALFVTLLHFTGSKCQQFLLWEKKITLCLQ